MKILSEIEILRNELDSLPQDCTIGFVPTMGFLHEGHLSLVDQSLIENNISVVSIFVNPAQFSPNEDLKKYPRNLKRDIKLLQDRGVDYLFTPSEQVIYPNNYLTFINVQDLENKLCGLSRPSHFKGVTTIVMKLFNIITPTIAYFGRKDAQQAIILKKMVSDLNYRIRIKTLPIVRDPDGLALSSRNKYMSDYERKQSLLLPESLKLAREKILKGNTNAPEIINTIRDKLKESKEIDIDYIEVVHLNSLKKITKIDINNTLVAVAIKIGTTRLIDNFILGEF